MVTFTEFLNRIWYLCVNNIEDGYYLRYCVNCCPNEELIDEEILTPEVSSDSDVEPSPSGAGERAYISGYIDGLGKV